MKYSLSKLINYHIAALTNRSITRWYHSVISLYGTYTSCM